MFKKRPRCSSKVRPTDKNAPEQQNISQDCKRRRLDLKPKNSQPPGFWDALLKVWLTRSALREFDRRNALLKRQQDSLDGQHVPQRRVFAPDFVAHCSSGHLSNLKHSARRGGPDLRDLRGCPEPVYSVPSSMSTASGGSKKRGSESKTDGGSHASNARVAGEGPKPTRKSRSGEQSGTKPSTNTSTYDRNFEQKPRQNRIYPPLFGFIDAGEAATLPSNFAETADSLAGPPSQPSSNIDWNELFQTFRKKQATSKFENEVMSNVVVPILDSDHQHEYERKTDVKFGNFELLDECVSAQPDFYYGALPNVLDADILGDLNKLIDPARTGIPILPNFFLEVKGKRGLSEVAELQVAYDGALGARAMHALINVYAGDPVCDCKAHTISATYHQGILRIFAHHLDEKNGERSYYMSELDSFLLFRRVQDFQSGITAFRNSRDWAKTSATRQSSKQIGVCWRIIRRRLQLRTVDIRRFCK